MCLPHYHSASIFQLIDKIEHAVNTTITEYYGQADKNKFTEAVDRAQQEMRGRVLIKLAVEKSRKIILAWERCCFSQWLKLLGRANPSTRNKRWTYDLLVTCPDAVSAEPQETCGNKTCCILLGLDVTTLPRASTTTHPLYCEARRTREERGSPSPSLVSAESSVLPCTICLQAPAMKEI